jgi:hypothetical protein
MSEEAQAVGAAVTTAACEAKVLPVSYVWYRDEAVWLVGISGAVLGAAASQYERLGGLVGMCRLLTLAGLGLFLITFLLAALLYFWIVSLANNAELDPGSDDLASAKFWVEHLHLPVLLCFFGAVIITVAGVACAAIDGKSGGPYAVQGVTYTDPACRCSRHLVVRIDTKTGAACVLAESSGKWDWTPVADAACK